MKRELQILFCFTVCFMFCIHSFRYNVWLYEQKLEPLAYTKYAHEGDDHTQEFITYSYQAGKTSVHAKLTRNVKLRHNTVIPTLGCVYDMMTVVYYARTLDYSTMKKGDDTGCLLISIR